MKKIFWHIVMWILLLCMMMNSASANENAQCPFPHKTELTSDEIISKVNQCIEAREKNQHASITEFLCPGWEFSLEDQQPLSYERIAVSVAINLLMNEIDKKMQQYMQSLTKNRSKDVVAWTQEYGACIDGKANSPSLDSFYSEMCSFGYISQLLNNNSQKRVIIGSSEEYPQQMCLQLANKKRNMWRNVAENIMTQSVYKSYQNDSDAFVEGVQWKYREVIDKFHIYQKLIFRAASKITHYIKEAVK